MPSYDDLFVRAHDAAEQEQTSKAQRIAREARQQAREMFSEVVNQLGRVRGAEPAAPKPVALSYTLKKRKPAADQVVAEEMAVAPAASPPVVVVDDKPRSKSGGRTVKLAKTVSAIWSSKPGRRTS